MKRVLIFSLAYFPHVGGAEVAIKEITDRLSDTEFHMLTLDMGGAPAEEKLGNIVVHRIGRGRSYISKMLFVPLAALAARRLHRQHPFDAAWAMMAYMALPIALADLPIPYAITLQEGDPFEHVYGRKRIALVRPLLTRGFRNAAALTAISSYLSAWAARLGYRGTPELIPNGVDVERFTRTYPRESVQAMKEKLGKKEGDIFLVTTSRLVHKNAVDDVIRALASLPKNLQFLIYGIGPDETKLRHLAEECGVAERARFMGHLDHADLPLALSACDIFIRPSRSEGMGISFIEAMAAGIPVIATQEGGIA
ncbi:MAG TPA: glycosyltransferase family 4 protein, partial [Candidatus Paceibacterota bacterium]|nr:glycosyltransferase family 4 protein [Candidatus Paceibacterota bacterium]